MKPRHAAALALVWFLMTPPYEQTANRIHTKAPLFDWHMSASFASSVVLREVSGVANSFLP